MAAQKPYLRTQDLHTITMAPDVLQNASLKLLQRMHLAGGGADKPRIPSLHSAQTPTRTAA